MEKSKVPYLTDEQWSTTSTTERALLIAAQEVDRYKVREVGRNDGPRVRAYLKAAGVSVAAAWCASFVTWCALEAGRERRSLPAGPASACNWIHWKGAKLVPVDEVKRGDVFGWCDAKKWRGHLGFVVKAQKVLGVWFIKTIEGNTDDTGGRDGDGVYRRTRRVTKDMRFLRY